MDPFAMFFGSALLGILAGGLAFIATGENSVVGWIVGAGVAASMFWVFLKEGT